MNGKLFVVSAPSGAGKNSLIQRALKQFPCLIYSVSATTRSPRGSERDGVDYFFKTPAEFENMIRNGELLEYEQVHGQYYGTPRAFVNGMLTSGRSVIMDIDVQGRIRLDSAYPDAVGIFIMPPSIETLGKRLINRGEDAPETIRVRLQNAQTEITAAQTCGKYKYTVINDDLDRAADRMAAIIRENQ